MVMDPNFAMGIISGVVSGWVVIVFSDYYKKFKEDFLGLKDLTRYTSFRRSILESLATVMFILITIFIIILAVAINS